jgi:hypothetical protein
MSVHMHERLIRNHWSMRMHASTRAETSPIERHFATISEADFVLQN